MTLERGCAMTFRNCILLVCLAVSTGPLWAEERFSDMSDADIRAAESKRAMESSYAETFAEAFLDPNIMIGIFEPVEYSLSAMKSLGEEWMEHLDEYFTVSNKRFLIVLKPEKVIRGVLEVPLVFCCPVHPAFVLDRNGGKSTPGFMPFSGRRWILALEKTTRQKRIALYGVVVADCSFINDRTFFKEHNSGYGVLCLEPVGEPDRNTRVVPEDAIVDWRTSRRSLRS